MPSTNKTTHFGLSQPLPSDRPMRDDVVKDNQIIDTALYEIQESVREFKPLGLYADYAALVAAHPTGAAGDAYAVGTALDNVIYIWGVSAGAWQNIGKIQGQGLPMGGTEKQLPVKASGTDFDVEWKDPGDIEAAFTQAVAFLQLTSGEALKTSLGKLMKWFASPEGFTPAFTQAASLANLVSGESLGTSLGKIMKIITDKALAGTAADVRTAIGLPTASGSWTPTVYGTTTAGTPTYSSRGGSYTRVGGLMLATCNFVMSAKGGIAGDVRIGGLPAASIGTAAMTYAIAAGMSGISNLLQGEVAANYIALQYNNAQVTASQILDNFQMYDVTVVYRAA